MASRGFRYEPDPIPQSAPVDYRLSRWGVYDLELAKQWGYGGPVDDPTTSNEMKFLASLNEDAKNRFEVARTGNLIVPVAVKLPNGQVVRSTRGFQPDSCMGLAWAKVFGSIEAYDRYEAMRSQVETMVFEADKSAEADPQFTGAIQKWSRCMAERGYQFKSPLDPAPTFRDPSSREAIKAAVADVSCKQQVRLLDEWDAALSRALGSRAEEVAALLQLINETRSAVVARAKAG